MIGNIKKYIKTWEKRCYSDGLPDESPIEILDLVPSYKRIVMAILKNDYPLKSLGFTPPKSEYYGQLKKIEIDQRNIIKGIEPMPRWVQLEFNFNNNNREIHRHYNRRNLQLHRSPEILKGAFYG